MESEILTDLGPPTPRAIAGVAAPSGKIAGHGDTAHTAAAERAVGRLRPPGAARAGTLGRARRRGSVPAHLHRRFPRPAGGTRDRGGDPDSRRGPQVGLLLRRR